MSIYRTNNPMEYAQVDGIVIDESAPAPSIRGVGTGVAILVGQFNKGDFNKITEPGSRARIVEMYGDASPGYNAILNKRFSRLKIIRVNQTDAVKASHTFAMSGTDIVTFEAITAGTAGNSITVTITTAATDKTYVVTDGTAIETYTDIAIAALATTINGVSTLVTVDVLSTSSNPANAASTALTGGAETIVTDTAYQTALAVAEMENSGNILFLDNYNETRNGFLKTHAAETEDKMVIMAGAETETVAEAVSALGTLRDTQGRLIYAYNWIETLVGGVKTFVSPASFLASLISNTSAHIDPAWSQNTQFLYGVSDLKQQLTRADYIALVNAGIASFEFNPDIGFKLKSGVVTQIADSEKVTILRRRMADFLTNSIGRFLNNYQNAPNSADERLSAKAAIINFIEDQEQLGVLPKDTEVQNGSAKIVDINSLNTNDSIAEGKFYINYRQRIYSSMRYIILIAEIGQGVVVTEADQ